MKLSKNALRKFQPHPSLKKETIFHLCSLLATEAFAGNFLILLTPSGTIYGKPILDGDVKPIEEIEFSNEPLQASQAISIVHQLLVGATEAYDNSTGSVHPLPGNDGYLLLKEVTVRPSDHTTHHFSNLTVFFDQIIGVTIGDMN